MPLIFSDPVLDQEVKNKQRLLYDSVSHQRQIRQNNAYKEWMKDFLTEPLLFKKSLILRIESLESQSNLHPHSVGMLNNLKNQLQSGEYCEGTNAHALYRGSYEDRQLAFVWPTQEEIELRQQEESELLARINK